MRSAKIDIFKNSAWYALSFPVRIKAMMELHNQANNNLIIESIEDEIIDEQD